MSPGRLVTLLTDFGPGSVYVGQMHGVLRTHAADLQIVDLAHDCPPGGIAAAGYLLAQSFGHFPPGTVHVAVVDPGVGSERKILAARAHDYTFLAPDNGLLGAVLTDAAEPEVRSVENESLMADLVAPTFHGRDVFAPVAAFLASGGALSTVGPRVAPLDARWGPAVHDGGITGTVLLVDPFGNLVTDVPQALLQALGPPEQIVACVGGASIAGLERTFSDVALGASLIYVGSGDHLEVAVNGGRASEVLGLGVGDPVEIMGRG